MAVAKYLHRYPILGKIYVKNDICSQRRRLLSIPFPLQSTIFFFRKGWAAKNSRSHRAFQLRFQQLAGRQHVLCAVPISIGSVRSKRRNSGDMEMSLADVRFVGFCHANCRERRNQVQLERVWSGVRKRFCARGR